MTPLDCMGRTQMLVLQPTPFCNLDCGYCYLPDRNDRHQMPLEIVEAAVRFVVDGSLAARDFSIVWHAGEPLVVPPSWYRAAFARIAKVAPVRDGWRHRLQTNATLVDEAWCDLFAEHAVQVGVSLDGPARIHDARRRTRSGRGSFDRVMRGVDLLRRRGIPFTVISVVGSASLDAADEIMDFFVAEGIREIGFSVEEVEGINTSSTLLRAGSDRKFRSFLARVLDRATDARPQVIVREHRDLLAQLLRPDFGRAVYNSQNEPFRLITISSRGAIFTFSPELAGQRDLTYGDLAVGHLPDNTLVDVLQGDAFVRMWRDIQQGVARCRTSCDYYNLCQGGAPANKLAEHGTFAATETRFCRLAVQAVADVTLARIERRLGPAGAA